MAESIIMEIRAGAGGDEAAIFAKDLFKMYSKYAQSQGWIFEIKEKNDSSLGGLKQIVFEVKGEGAYEQLKYEAGVHRVQRVPETEKSNRLHTSTATVAVLNQTEAKEIEIKPADLRYDFYKASGKGGQNVNKRQTAIRITHLPTGLVVSSQGQRNLEQNRQTALAMLKAKLEAKEHSRTARQVIEARRGQIGQAERAEKIRTYNFPQNRITDHRIQKSFHNLERIMEGKLDKLTAALKAQFSSA